MGRSLGSRSRKVTALRSTIRPCACRGECGTYVGTYVGKRMACQRPGSKQGTIARTDRPVVCRRACSMPNLSATKMPVRRSDPPCNFISAKLWLEENTAIECSRSIQRTSIIRPTPSAATCRPLACTRVARVTISSNYCTQAFN